MLGKTYKPKTQGHLMVAIPFPPPHSESSDITFEPLLDTEQAAALLQIHPKTLQKLARGGTVDGIRIGKLWRFRASALNAWLAKMTR